jgi:hypothetical protein
MGGFHAVDAGKGLKEAKFRAIWIFTKTFYNDTHVFYFSRFQSSCDEWYWYQSWWYTIRRAGG